MNERALRGDRPLLVVMGVSGSGKTTVGAGLAEALAVPFIDGDDLHPPANVATMRAGRPLDDADRAPWLAEVGRALARARGGGVVVACSALKRRYREAILSHAPEALFMHLTAPPAVLEQRMSGREGHFMPTALLGSQLDTLEDLAADEPGFVIDVNGSEEEVIAAALRALGNTADGPVGSGRTAGQ